jgi:hypothetical protein
MKNPNTKTSLHLFHPMVITINLMLLLFMGTAFGIGNSSLAQDSGSAPANSTDTPITSVQGDSATVNTITPEVCVFELTKFADPEFEKYRTFMEDNFKNKSRTSSLLELGIQRYDQFKADIRAKLETLVGQSISVAAASNATNAVQLPGLFSCEAKAQEYLDDASKMLEMRAVTTSSIKKASIFVEKYKQINGKLRSLNLDIMKMVTNITAFEQKLPCYLKTCI